MNQTRRNEIVELLEKQGAVSNAELMESFGISIETVRRDLAYLEKHGFLERVYGGAVKRKFMREEPNYVNRESKNAKEKTVIAKRTGELIEDGESVFFDIGTTVLEVAKNLNGKRKFNAFTNALRTAIALSENGVDVTLTGGNLRGGEYAVSGSIAEGTMRLFNVDKAIIGVAGIDENGVTDFIVQEASLRRQVIENAREVVVVADFSKFGVRSSCNVCEIEQIDVLITDEKAPRELVKKFEKKGVKVIIAK
jgi:DeoR/GlpR family transcriptional regulator of sugar metabolism